MNLSLSYVMFSVAARPVQPRGVKSDLNMFQCINLFIIQE